MATMLVILTAAAGHALDPHPTDGDRLAAALLLQAPAGSPTPPPPAPGYHRLRAALVERAVRDGVLDPREGEWTLTQPAAFQNHLDRLRAQTADLADAPPAWAADRLPPRAEINRAMEFNRRYAAHLAARRDFELDRAAVLDAAIRETDRLYRVWDAARDARTDFYYVTVRRAALARLRDLVGDEAFQAGRLPTPVPTQLFNEMN